MALSTLTGACWQALAATIPNFRPIPERRDGRMAGAATEIVLGLAGIGTGRDA